jgi:gamma-glutamylcyclotransferase (GGCT)/AIG2-like uncharacterized protein YtfP
MSLSDASDTFPGGAADAELAVFVYGTLLPGFKNHANVVRGRALRAEPATLAGVRLHHYAAGFPGMTRAPAGGAAPASGVAGALLYFARGDAREVLADLDLLEDYFGAGDARNQYNREAVAARRAVDGCVVTAWAYFSLLDAAAEGAVPVNGGDWRAFMAEKGLQDAADDWREKLAAARGAGEG